MSLESAKAFVERMKTDEEFAKQVASRKDKEERMKFVSEQGFSFSDQEIEQIKQELSDDELNEVAGAFCSIDFTCNHKWNTDTHTF